MGSEPIESEIPLVLSDFPETVQLTFVIYAVLQDIWDSMGGNYLGKDLGNIFKLFELYEVEPNEQLLVLSLIQQMDAVRSHLVGERLKQEREASSNKKA